MTGQPNNSHPHPHDYGAVRNELDMLLALTGAPSRR